MSEENLQEVLTRLLNKPISDEKKVLELIISAITTKSVDPDLVRQAVTQAVFNYENQLRVFMVSVANAQLQRILRLINLIDKLETDIDKKDYASNLEPKDLVKLYALYQSNLTQSLDYVKKIADMRLELQQANSAITSGLTNTELEEVKTLSGLPKLNAKQRNSVRRLIEGIADVIQTEGSKDIVSVD